MKNYILVLLTLFIVFILGGCGSEGTVDYKSPHEAAVACENGEDIIGKTVTVRATMDSYFMGSFEGFIYREPNLEIRKNIDVVLMVLNEATGEYENAMYSDVSKYITDPIYDIEENDTIKVTVYDVKNDDYQITIYGILEE